MDHVGMIDVAQSVEEHQQPAFGNSKLESTIKRKHPKQDPPAKRRCQRGAPPTELEAQPVEGHKLLGMSGTSVVESQSSPPPACPVCGKLLPNRSEIEVSQHVEECLTLTMLEREKQQSQLPPQSQLEPYALRLSNSIQYIGNHSVLTQLSVFVVQQLHAPLSNPSECIICFEPFDAGNCCVFFLIPQGQHVSRLECLCVYHEACLNQWLAKSPHCPLHMSGSGLK